MKKSFFLGLGILFSISISAQSNCSIQTEGIYVAHVDSSTKAYLRFFGKDSVITTTSDIPRNISHQHIIKEYKKYILHGTYKLKGCFLKIKVEGISGKAKLEGYILGENIGLSKINLQNNSYTDLFFFHKQQ